ncbi:hypothetical protein HmCmsJML142_02548 [Escherichia coli]|nr:hypothetical protein HmCmsJML142_02548 [Escherichia coli]
MTVQSVVSATDGHRRSDPGLSSGLAQDPEVQGRYFYQVAGRHPGVFPTLQYLPPHPGCHPEPGRQGRCSLRTCRVLAEHDVLYLRRLMHQGERRRESMRRFYDDEYAQARPEVRVCLQRLNLMPDHRTFQQYRWRSPAQKSSKFCRDLTLPAYRHRLESRTPAFVKRHQRESRLLRQTSHGRSANRDADRHHPSPVNHHELMSKRGYTLRRQRVRPVCLC